MFAAIAMIDPTHDLAARGQFFSGSVWFFRDKQSEASAAFDSVLQTHPHSRYAPLALKRLIVLKLLALNDDATRPCQLVEVSELIELARRSYPEIDRAFLERQKTQVDEER